jgi:hypothetical protein
MARVSLMVVSADRGRARFIVETNGVWQDGDLGLPPTWRTTADNIFTQFTAFLQVPQPLDPAWLGFQCRALYKAILPDATKKILTDVLDGAKGSPPALFIYSHPAYDNVPWELLHDGTDYLGLRWRIARMPIVAQPPARSDKTHLVSNIFQVLGRGVMDPAAEQPLFNDWLSTFNGAQTTSFPSAQGPQMWPTINTIARAWAGDILHLTCHGIEKGWTLDQSGGDPSLIDGTVVDYVDLNGGKPLVFANACSPAGKVGLSSSLAHRFIARGTVNVVGTFAPVTRDLAIQFAREFYSTLLTPVAGDTVEIAEAIRRTKEHFHALKTQAGAVFDPSYLFYCLYGDATSKYELK